MYRPLVVGAEAPPPPAPEPDEPLTLANLGKALGKITPTLLIVGIATGAAFAVGAGLADRYVFERRRR